MPDAGVRAGAGWAGAAALVAGSAAAGLRGCGPCRAPTAAAVFHPLFATQIPAPAELKQEWRKQTCLQSPKP
jgi:hypothetical protein